MRLKSSPKLPDFHRGKTPAQTLAHVTPLLSKLGITRLSDITGLDRIGLPVWSAVVPKSPPGATPAQMLERVIEKLPQDLFPDGAKAGWWAKCVQLDLEAKGIVKRANGSPVRLHQ